MAVFDELSVEIGSDVADFTAGMESAESSLNSFDRAALQAAAKADLTGESIDELASDSLQAAGAMQALRSQTDDVGDEFTETAIKASAASGGMTQYSAASTAASGASANLSTVLVASLAPALVVVASALVPVVTALGGLVAIGASIAGVGLIGAMGAIATNTKQLKQAAKGVVSTLKSEFAPAIDAATGVLLDLLNSFEDIIPQLVPSEEAIANLSAGFEAFGEAVISNLPALVDFATTIAQEFLPAAAELTDDVLSELPGFLNTLVTTFQRLQPEFEQALNLLIRLGPELLQFGFAALRVVGPAIADITRLTIGAVDTFNDLDNTVQNIILTVGVLGPVLLGIASLFTGPVALAIGGVTAAVIALKRAWDNNFAGIQGTVRAFSQQVKRVLPAVKGAFNAFVNGLGIQNITRSLKELEKTLGTELRETVKALKPVFGDLKTFLEDNKQEFVVLGAAVGFVLEKLIELTTFFIEAWGPAIRKEFIPQIRLAIDVIDVLLSKVTALIKGFSALKDGNLAEAATNFNDVANVEQTNIGVESASQEVQQTTQTIELIVEEDTELTNARIRNTSEDVIVEKERRAKRNTGGTTRP